MDRMRYAQAVMTLVGIMPSLSQEIHRVAPMAGIN